MIIKKKKTNKIVESKSKSKIEKKNNFPRYASRQSIARFICLAEIFKLQKEIKGTIVDCGVYLGNSLMSFAKLSSIYEPYNYQRKIIGFDTFEGFLEPDNFDKSNEDSVARKGLFKENYNIYEELLECIDKYDENRFLNNKKKIELVKGDACKTIPNYIKKNQHLLISLLFLDFDLYKPTEVALKHFLPRMGKGSIICFDQLNNNMWPGETKALLNSLKIQNFTLKSFDYEPNISYIIL